MSIITLKSRELSSSNTLTGLLLKFHGKQQRKGENKKGLQQCFQESQYTYLFVHITVMDFYEIQVRKIASSHTLTTHFFLSKKQNQ